MRSNIYARQLRALSKATALISLAGLAAACSTDASRWDAMTTASVQATPNQRAIIQSKTPLQQAYPGDVARSGVTVAESNETLQIDKVTRTSVSNLSVARSSIPSITVVKPAYVRKTTAVAGSGPIVLQPRRTQSNPLRIAGTDQVTTSSIKRVDAVANQINRPAGWNSAKGTWVAMKSGETLYNMSRRYGVPVAAIMSANKISDGNTVEAGRRILIPTYNYANSAPVSAPDNNPITKASRSSRGFQGQARGSVTVPKARRPRVNVAAVTVPTIKAPTARTSGGRYTVQSGDTLSAIAYRSGVSAAAIKQANNMSSDMVRLGQRLVIPGSSAIIGSNVDRMATGSIPKTNKRSKAVKPVLKNTDKVASLSKSKNKLLKSAATTFRWPAEGRLLSKFGERSSSGSNDGIDISMPEGTPVRASEGGTVIYSGSELEDFGKLILLSHPGGWVSAYAHASATLVRRGEKVRRGQVIAKSGRTGNATVPKLHFELRKDSNPVNPLKHLAR